MRLELTDTISSVSNPLVKQLRSLERKKGRAEHGLFLAEGVRLVAQGLKNRWELKTLLISKDVFERSHIVELAKTAAGTGARVIGVPTAILEKVARKSNPQAVVGAFVQQHRSLETLSDSARNLWIGLFEIRDPGNLGTILRTADCANVAGIVLIGNCCDPYSVETVRASMGSIFDTPFAHAGFETFNHWRVQQNLKMIAASVNGTTRHDEPIYGEKTLILMGNEQAGLPTNVESACDTLALIPMRGGADSLNLAQATAIMTYEAWRQKGYA